MLFFCVQNIAAVFSSWLLPRCLFILDLINHELEMNSPDNWKPHMYREYTVRHTCFFVQWCAWPSWKTGFFTLGDGCRYILDVFSKRKAEELLEIYFIWVSLAECARHSLVLSIMQVNVRIGPNTCITRELRKTW